MTTPKPVSRLAKACFVSLGLLLIASPFANAQVGSPSWRQGGCVEDGCYYYRVIRRDYPFILTKTKLTTESTCNKYYCAKDRETEFNCDGWKSRRRTYISSIGKTNGWSEWGKWKDILPGTVGAANLRAACRP